MSDCPFCNDKKTHYCWTCDAPILSHEEYCDHMDGLEHARNLEKYSEAKS